MFNAAARVANMNSPITFSIAASWSARALRLGTCHAELDGQPDLRVNFVPESRLVTGASSDGDLPRDAGLIPTYGKPQPA
jgi:hypothetical protein